MFLKEKFKYTKCIQAFTVLEMALVLLVFGILLTGFLSYYKIYTEQMRMERTERSVKNIRQALLSFRITNDYYPCPARADLPVTDVNFGQMDCTIVPVSGTLQGIVPNNIVPFLDSYDPVQRGFKDSWGIPLTYAVTENLSMLVAGDPFALPPVPPTMPFDSTAGSIAVIDEFDRPTGGISAAGDAHFVVLSTGGDAVCPAGTFQEENCDADNVFRDSLRYDGNGVQRYNDYIAFYNRADLSIWSNHAPGGTAIGDAKNDNSGNIGINVNVPSEKIDVDGNINVSSNTFVNEICNDATGTCLKPEQLFNFRCDTPTPANGHTGGARTYAKGVTLHPDGSLTVLCDVVTPLPYTIFSHGSSCLNGVKFLLTNGRVLCY